MSSAVPPTPENRACVPAPTLAAFSEKVGLAFLAPMGLFDFGLFLFGWFFLKMIKPRAGDMPSLKGSESTPQDINQCCHGGQGLERASLI